MNKEQEITDIRNSARAGALEYGYTEVNGQLTAPLGKFESEPYYAVYFYECMMHGDGEGLMSGENCDGDIFALSREEWKAFDLDPDTTHVVLWHSDQGFEHLIECSDKETADILEAYENMTAEEEGE